MISFFYTKLTHKSIIVILSKQIYKGGVSYEKNKTFKILAISLVFAVIVGSFSILSNMGSVHVYGTNSETSLQDIRRTYTVVDTGQSKYYSDSTQISAPEKDNPFYGQDKSILQLHNGAVGFNNLDRGVEFYFELDELK